MIFSHFCTIIGRIEDKKQGTVNMASMKDFLTAYYNRLIFNKMSHEQFVQFCNYLKNNTATDNQKIWAKEYLKTDSGTGEYLTDPAGLYIRKNIPNPQDRSDEFYLTNDEWIKLFTAFQRAFQSMDANKKSFKYNDKANAFFNKYFGAAAGGTGTNLFQSVKIKESVKSRLYNATSPDKTLYKFLNDNKSKLKSQLSNGYYNIFDDDFTYENLLSGIKDEKYNSDPGFRRKMNTVVEFIQGNRHQLDTISGIDPATIPDFSDFEDWFDDNAIPVAKLHQFKTEYRSLLNTLYTTKDVREVFENHDGGKISGPLNKAMQGLSYNDQNSEDYVQPKRYDELSWREKISEWWGDTYSDVLEKYVKFKGDELYFSDEARLICKKLPKDLKKTDNLDTVLQKIPDIKDKLKKSRDNKAVKHLDWFEKTLNEIKKDPKMEKTWAGALQHGNKMRNLVKEIIIKAIKENKIDEAKTTLEMLSVLHFGFTTSKIMDTIKEQDLTLFSHKDLSWNKNKVMQFITSALDKSLKYAMVSVGYGITTVVNAYRLSQTKIKQYSDKENNLKNAHDEYLKQNSDDKQALKDALNANKRHSNFLTFHTNQIMGGKTYDATKTDIENTIRTNETNLNNIKTTINNEINVLTNAYLSCTPTYTHPDILDKDELERFIFNATEALKQDPVEPFPKPKTTIVQGTLQNAFNKIETNWNKVQGYASSLKKNRKKLDFLVDGIETVQQLNQQITEQQEEFDKWDEKHTDKMEELIQYWNMLETGRNTKTGPMYNWFHRLSKAKAQKDLENNKAAIIERYNTSHSIAA